MKLIYYKGQNFGDALNLLVFNKFLPNYFDKDEKELFFGIGSILGFNQNPDSKKIIFSSGYGFGDELTYGKIPIIDETYDILCVRGPLTAQALKIHKHAAITDGAALLKNFNFKLKEKKHKISYIPHVGSEKYFNWKLLCDKAGYNYISPANEVNDVINEILKSELIICEAMHGAIVADTLRVPWIPFKAYKDINEFKWTDWCQSLGMDYKPNHSPSLFSSDFLSGIVKHKSKNVFPKTLNKLSGRTLFLHQSVIKTNKVLKIFKDLKNKKTYLSNETVLNSKVEQLLEKLELFKKKYPKN